MKAETTVVGPDHRTRKEEKVHISPITDLAVVRLLHNVALHMIAGPVRRHQTLHQHKSVEEKRRNRTRENRDRKKKRKQKRKKKKKRQLNNKNNPNRWLLLPKL